MMVEDLEAEFTFFYRKIENSPTSGMIHTQQLLITDRRPLMSVKTKKNLHEPTQEERKKKKKTKKQDVTCMQGYSCEGQFPAPWEGSFPMEKLDQMQGEFWSLR